MIMIDPRDDVERCGLGPVLQNADGFLHPSIAVAEPDCFTSATVLFEHPRADLSGAGIETNRLRSGDGGAVPFLDTIGPTDHGLLGIPVKVHGDFLIRSLDDPIAD